jgi:cobaltochelatase CobN
MLLSHAETDVLVLQRALEDLPAGFPPVTGHSLNGVTSPNALRDLVGGGPGTKLVVIARVHGAPDSVRGLSELVQEADRDGWHVVVISGVTSEVSSWPRTSAVSLALTTDLTSYFMAGGVSNVAQAIRRVAHELLGVPAGFEPPQQMPAHGLYHPDLLVTTVAEWESYRPPDKPVALVLFYRAHVLSANLYFVDDLVRALEFRGFAAVGLFTSSLRDKDATGMPAALQLLAPPAVIINTVSYPVLTLTSLEQPPEEAQLTAFERIGTPVIQAICCGTPRSTWSASGRGLGPAEAAMNVALPECDGRVITVPISFKENHRYVPDGERMGRVTDFAWRLAVLRTKANRAKRIAIVLSNSGGKAQKVGGAVGLDTPASILRFLSDLRDSGYHVGDSLPESADELMSVLLARGCYDERVPLEASSSWRLTRERYVAWFNEQSQPFREAMRGAWGEPQRTGPTLPPPFWRNGKQSLRTPFLALAEPYSDEVDYLFSGVAFGNVLVAIQPPRGFGFDAQTIYHSPDLPPCHHYAAFYHWLAQGWRSDALIHFGTHGTLEWLPGKALATSADCFPDVLLGELPVFYPFVINNPGEGAQAKRRSHAVIIDHLIPPLTQAELYGPLAALARLVEEYYRAETLDPAQLLVLRQQIWDLVRAGQLEEDLKQIRRERHAEHVHSWDDRLSEQGVPRGLESLSGRGFAHLLEDLDAYLCDLGRAQIRSGLHVFGVPPADGDRLDLVFAILCSANGAVPSLVTAVAQASGLSVADARGRREVERVARDVLGRLAEYNFSVASVEMVVGACALQGAVDQLRDVLRFACDVLVPNLAKTTDETRNLLAALEGHHVPAGPSGAPTRGMAHVLPTGRNFYTVDPRGLPTPAAWATGEKLADAVARRYRDEAGRWPESVALTIWGTPTMRTGGDEIGEALALIGVRPVWEPATRRTCGFEVILLSDLQRPRIDVVLRISGFFRDAFPALIQLFDEAVQRVLWLDEPPEQNFVRKHWLAETAALIASGVESGAAGRRASYRVFSSKPGTYGTGAQELIENSSWREQRELGDVVMAWGGWAYGVADVVGALDGLEAPDAFRTQLARIDLTVHNSDNREQDLFDSSDHYEYQGGLSAAVSALTGKQPRAYRSDSSDPTRPDVRTLQAEALRVFRSRVANPKWLAGIQRHGYRGGIEMVTTVDSLFGFAATAGIVTDWMFEAVAENYARGSSRDFLERFNPWALNAIAERLLEAEQRQLWRARSETLEALRSVLLASETRIEEHTQ